TIRYRGTVARFSAGGSPVTSTHRPHRRCPLVVYIPLATTRRRTRSYSAPAGRSGDTVPVRLLVVKRLVQLSQSDGSHRPPSTPSGRANPSRCVAARSRGYAHR